MEQLKQLKKQLSLEKILLLFIIICPLLDMLSFIFRNSFDTSISPSTFIRPIIPIIAIFILFFKNHYKKQMIIGAFLYGVYGIVHLIVFQLLKSNSSYSSVVHEAQYIINYSYMILNLVIYTFVFIKKETLPLKKSLLLAITIYIISIYIAIFTGTSSPTYEEGMGYKGWFESGNSISSILVLATFILLPLIKKKDLRIMVAMVLALVGIFLIFLIGTRVGLFGFLVAMGIYMLAELLISLLGKYTINTKMLIAMGSTILIVGFLVTIIGSNTLQRRKHLQGVENDLLDERTGQVTHLSGDLTKMSAQIENQEMSQEEMQQERQKAIVDLYHYANRTEMANNDMRKQQLIYHLFLLKYQQNPFAYLFGNGYLSHFRELVLEMEIPAFLFNFGLIRIYFIFRSIFSYFSLWLLYCF